MKPSFRQVQHNKKLKKILRVAARLFANKGYEKVSIEEIAWRLKLSKGSLYHYFESKEEVLFLIQMDALKIGIAAMTQVLESDQAPLRKLRNAIKTHVEIIAKKEVAGALKQQELILPPPLRSRVIASRDHYEEIFRRIVKEGVDAGIFSEKNWKLSCLATLCLLNGTPKWYSPKKENSLEEIGDALADFVIKGFLADDMQRPQNFPLKDFPSVAHEGKGEKA